MFLNMQYRDTDADSSLRQIINSSSDKLAAVSRLTAAAY